MDQTHHNETVFGGNTFASFEAFNNIISKNDGIRNFSVQTNSCSDTDCPFADGDQTHIKLTNKNHDVNQLEESFINMRLRVNCQLGKTYTAHQDGTTATHNYKCLRIGLGLKNAPEIIRQLEMENENVDCDYLQTDMTRETNAYHNFKPKSEKMTRKFSHTPYENIHEYDNSIAGTYIDPTTFTANTPQDVFIDLSFWINDLLGLQAFGDWHNSFGELVAKLILSRDAFVWCQVNPKKVADLRCLVYEDMDDDRNTEIQNKVFTYDHKFAQCGTPLSVITKIEDTCAITIDQDILTINSVICEVLECNSVGFKLTEATNRALATLYTPQKPMIIPAEFVDCKNFSQRATADGIDTDFTYALHNVTDAILVFPKNSRHTTCYENPMYKNLQLSIDGKLYPVKAVNTTGSRFFTLCLNASELSGTDEPSKEYQDSLIQPLNNPRDGKRYKRTWSDQTSFYFPIQTERNGKGYFFDGIETGNDNVKVRLVGTPMYSGENDTYYVPVASQPDNHPPPPQVWLNRDVYWTYDPVYKLKFHKTGTPPEYDNI